MPKKNIFILILALFFFFLLTDLGLAAQTCATDADCTNGLKCVSDPCGGTDKICGRPLESCYPQIPGATQPKTVAEGLPEYVDYLFHLAVIIIGFAILAALVYAGVSYFLSFGNPAKLSDAKEGIFAAFLGAVILLSAYLIFNTINPQLTILELPPVPILGGVVTQGIYICNYDITQGTFLADLQTEFDLPSPGPDLHFLDSLLGLYIDRQGQYPEFQVKATKALSKIIFKSESEQCTRINSSTNFRYPISPNNTLFAIPEVVEVQPPAAGLFPTTKHKTKFDYAIILYENDNFKGRSGVWPMQMSETNEKMRTVYGPYSVGDQVIESDYQFNVFRGGPEEQYKPGPRLDDIGGRARSVILIQKPDPDPGSSAPGVTLFSCLYYNAPGFCPKKDGDEFVTEVEKSFNTGNVDVRIADEDELGELKENTRSLTVRPEKNFLIMLYEKNSEEAQKGDGKGWTFFGNDQPDLTRYIDQCGEHCDWWRGWWLGPAQWIGLVGEKECSPCIKSIGVFKGLVL